MEMRWLKKNGEWMLQYRVKYDTTIRAGLNWSNQEVQDTAKYQWSDWTNVPRVIEEEE